MLSISGLAPELTTRGIYPPQAAKREQAMTPWTDFVKFRTETVDIALRHDTLLYVEMNGEGQIRGVVTKDQQGKGFYYSVGITEAVFYDDCRLREATFELVFAR